MEGEYIEPRTALWAAVEISWKDSAGKSFHVPASLEDTSLSGPCIRVPRPFVVGPRIPIKWHREQFTAIARNCRHDERGFLLGVRREPKNPAKAALATTISPAPSPSAMVGKSVHDKGEPTLPVSGKPEYSTVLAETKRRESSALLRAQMPTMRPRPLAESSIQRLKAELKVSGSSPRSERKVMQPQTLFPHFWRRPQDGDAPVKTTSPEAK